MTKLWRLRLVLVLACGLVVVACGGPDEATGTSAPTTVRPAVTETTAGAVPTTHMTTTTEGGSLSSSLRDVRADIGIASIALRPADEGGPHPTLEWESVEGAATYWLVLRDGSGHVYWAWTGADTRVRVGGGDHSELNQTAALYEPMTWMVGAVDGMGSLLASSDVATVSP
jgi:hypothetical protein